MANPCVLALHGGALILHDILIHILIHDTLILRPMGTFSINTEVMERFKTQHIYYVLNLSLTPLLALKVPMLRPT